MKKSYKRIQDLFTALGWALVALVVLFLWNLLIPEITGWKEINYLQAVGLLVLFRLLTSNSAVSAIVSENDREDHVSDDDEEEDLEYDSIDEDYGPVENDKDCKVKVIKRGNLEIKLLRRK